MHWLFVYYYYYKDGKSQKTSLFYLHVYLYINYKGCINIYVVACREYCVGSRVQVKIFSPKYRNFSGNEIVFFYHYIFTVHFFPMPFFSPLNFFNNGKRNCAFSRKLWKFLVKNILTKIGKETVSW